MSAILFITLQKHTCQIDLTQKDCFADIVFNSFENIHIWPTILAASNPSPLNILIGKFCLFKKIKYKKVLKNFGLKNLG